MKTVSVLYSLACMLLLLGMGSDVFFKQKELSLISMVVAVLLMLLAHRLNKRLSTSTISFAPDQKRKQFQRLLLGAAAGCIGGFILLRWQHPQLGLTFAITTSILTFGFLSGLFYWRLFVKSRG